MDVCQCFLLLPPVNFAFFLFHNMRQQLDPEFWIAKFGSGIKLAVCLFVWVFFFPRVQCKSVKAKICYSAEQQNILVSVKFVSGGKQTLSSFYTQKLYNYNASLKY